MIVFTVVHDAGAWRIMRTADRSFVAMDMVSPSG